ncbi:hypothetical protein OOZ19_05775 [Saccharopolyspora sp. NFXS83]|uniref:hypothetical protein n=1 Tax=Saccharopolyspora sp. NFXS83 TaxID=2993560 RepID=UPI00224B59D9|nr:hypothetical protein [Saccharopolyspora sp. NFXS83]MCX2729739.1 hypothetical protein [Saccharopolyspora sp. NFXS83]
MGEARRVVHVATGPFLEEYRAMCDAVLGVDEVEVLDGVVGMPCMACSRILALGEENAAGAAVIEVGSVLRVEPGP